MRALTRYRQRFEITWRPAPALAAALLALLVLGRRRAARRGGRDAAAVAAERAEPDGGFGGDRGQRSTGLYTGWAGLGLAAGGKNPRDLRQRRDRLGPRPPPPTSADLGELNRTIMLLRAAGLPPRVGDRDLVKELLAKRRPNGAFANRVNTTSFAIFALRADSGHGRADAGSPRRWIARQANRDGGFNFAIKGAASGIDDTGAALQALVAAGRRGTPTVRRAARFLARRQNPDGGYPLQPGGPSNAQSTAWAVQALVAAGRNPRSPAATGRSPRSPTCVR